MGSDIKLDIKVDMNTDDPEFWDEVVELAHEIGKSVFDCVADEEENTIEIGVRERFLSLFTLHLACDSGLKLNPSFVVGELEKVRAIEQKDIIRNALGIEPSPETDKERGDGSEIYG